MGKGPSGRILGVVGLVVLAMGFSLAACSGGGSGKGGGVDPPVTAFEANPTGGDAPLPVDFTDLSTGEVTEWAWDFGDGGSATVRNPTHVYSLPGTWTVSLTTTGPGGSDTLVKDGYLIVTHPAPGAAFSATPTSGTAPLSVQFTDLTTGEVTDWAWDFGEGGSASTQNPAHVYSAAGTWTVSLTATGPGGSDTLVKDGYVVVTPPAPVAAFTGAPRSGDATLPVQFTDTSTGEVDSWYWDFGDGTTSVEQSPTHDYVVVGEHTVSLTVTGPGGAHQRIEPQFVSVSEAGAGGADLPSTIWPDNGADITYCPPERLAFGAAAPQQHLNVFLPRGTRPAAGWPVLIATAAGGGLTVYPFANLHEFDASSARWHAFVEAGVAVVHYGAGADGLFYPPGDPTGNYESFDPSHDTYEKEAEWVVQWVASQTQFLFDTDRVAVYGSSQGGIMGLWACMGPDRARATGSVQVRASTKVAGIVVRQPPTSLWAFLQGSGLGVGIAGHFERRDLPGVPASALDQVTESLQKADSIVGFCFESPAVIAAGATQPVCLVYADPVAMEGTVPADLTVDANGYPNLHDRLGPPYIHDSWHGYVFFKMLLDVSAEAAAFHQARSLFAVRVEEALPPPYDYHTRTFSGPFNGPETDVLIHDWVRATLYVH